MEQNEEQIAVVINSEESLVALTAAGWALGDTAIISNYLDNDQKGVATDGDFDAFDAISSWIEIGDNITIKSHALYKGDLYVSGSDKLYGGAFYKIGAFLKITENTPTFTFDRQKVYIDIKNNVVFTNDNYHSSIDDALALYGCILAKNKECPTEFHDFDLELPDVEDDKDINDDNIVKFGCQNGTFREVKAIIDYIKANQTPPKQL